MTIEQIREFCLNDRNWFRAKYLEPLSRHSTRYWTFKTALNLLLQRTEENRVILETGCVRQSDPPDWGAGNSSLIFGDFIKHYGGQLISIDIEKNNLDLCTRLMKEAGYADRFRPLLGDSVACMQRLSGNGQSANLIFLDSFDYPLGELLRIYGGERDLDGALATLRSMTTEEIVNKHGKIFDACQQHCLKETQVAVEMLDEKGILLIDDLDLPGLGKPRLAREWLLQNGWECVLEDYASLWVRK